MMKKMKKQLSVLLVFALLCASVSLGFGFGTQALTSSGSWRIYGKTAAAGFWPWTWFEGTGNDVVVKLWSGPDGTGTLLYTSPDLGDDIKRVGKEGSITMTNVPTTNQIASITVNKVSGSDPWSCENITVYYTPSGGPEQQLVSMPARNIEDNNAILLGNINFFTEVHNHSIHFNANGGIGTAPDQTLIWGTADYLRVNTFSRNGYTFAGGWASSQAAADAGTVEYGDGANFLMPDNDVELWAVWVPFSVIPYTIRHYKENIEKTAFDILAATETLTGATGQRVFAQDNAYEGFMAVTPLASGYIIYDGSLVVNQYYTRNTYNFSFDANGGEGGGEVEMAYGAPFTAPAVTKEGFILAGWVPELPATVPMGGGSYTAQWIPNSYTITFDAAGGTGGTQQTVNYGDMPTAPTVAKEGYIFAGWQPELAQVTGNATYVAQWVFDGFIITFDAAGGTGGKQIPVRTNEIPVAPVVTRTGYTFIGWQPAIAAATEDATYTAQWTVNSYTITFDAANGTGGGEQILEYGAMPVPPTVTRTGYNFNGWSPVITAVTGDTVYYAQWIIKTFTIIFDANGGTGGTEQILNYGEIPTIPDVTREGFTFSGWLPNIGPAKADRTYVAQWTGGTVLITFLANGGVGGTVLSVTAGQMPTPPVVTRENYRFNGWSPAVTVANQDKTYTAQWLRRGDINSSDSITSLDALMVLQYVANLATLDAEQLLKADVDLNGVVNNIDALKILQFAGGNITVFI